MLKTIIKNMIPILLLAFCSGLKAQDLKNSDFKNTKWFTKNNDNNFYEADKITLGRILKFNSKNNKQTKAHFKLLRKESGDVTELHFKGNGILIVEDGRLVKRTNKKNAANWKWKFDPTKQILNLHFKQKLHSSFQIESMEKDSAIWKFERNKKETEAKVDLVVLNLVRRKA